MSRIPVKDLAGSLSRVEQMQIDYSAGLFAGRLDGQRVKDGEAPVYSEKTRGQMCTVEFNQGYALGRVQMVEGNA